MATSFGRVFFFAAATFASLGGAARPVAAQDLDIDSARALFKEAVSDEDELHRVDAALAKFRRVQSFKDSMNVRYRIGTCLEQLGQFAAALAAYNGAVAAGAGDAKGDVLHASQERAAALDARVAKVTLVLSPHAPADAEVRVDDAKIAAAEMSEPVVLDPGHHTFAGVASGVPPFHAALTLPEGSRITLTIALDPTVSPTPGPGAALAGPSTSTAGAGGRTAAPEDTSAATGPRTAGWITVSAGALLLAGSGVVALLQRGDVDDLHRACPGGACDAALQSSLSSERSRALLEEPIAVALGAAGLVAAGVGLYLVLAPHTPPARSGDALHISPAFGPTGGGVDLRGTF